jgi:GPI mannosyltransferase 3
MLHKYKYHLLSLLPFIITAIFSEGFLHPDEHYVTMEFLQTKISSFTRPDIYNWDFHERIRPWFQTFFYYCLYLIIPFKSPFMVAMVYRLISGLLGWYSLFLLSKKNMKAMLWVSWTWFVPFLLVRTSSESLSTSLFFLGMYFYQGENIRKNSLISGFFWGISFLIRFQMGIAIAIANIWYLSQKKSLKNLGWHSLIVILLIGLSVFVDYWGYGEWTFAPYNYFYTNLIESRASAYGIEPIWYYITKPIIKGGVFLPLILLISSVNYFKTNKRSIWLPVLLSFFIIHSIIPHKEVRFLTLIYISLVFLTFSQALFPLLKRRAILIPVIIINFLMMSKASLTPAEGLLSLYKKIYMSETTDFYTPANKQGHIFTFKMPFYEVIKRNTIGFELSKIEDVPKNSVILTTSFKQYNYLKAKCQLDWISYPEWIFQFNYSNWLSRSAITALWRCDS